MKIFLLKIICNPTLIKTQLGGDFEAVLALDTCRTGSTSLRQLELFKLALKCCQQTSLGRQIWVSQGFGEI